MTVRRYRIAGRTFSKVTTHGRPVTHVIEEGQFWKGVKSWEHRAVCGASIAGVLTQLQKVSCKGCRAAIEKLRDPADQDS